jgi:hypothetical protein
MQLHRIGRRAALLGGLAGVTVAAGPVAAVIPIEVVNRLCLVSVLLDGRPARMVLDTGAAVTVVSRAAASRMGLRGDPWVSTTLRGAGGLLERHSNVAVRQAMVDDVPLFQNRPGGGLSLPVTSADLGGADGLLGGDVLQHFTLVIDVPGGRFVLLTSPSMGRAAGAVPLTLLGRNLLLAPVTLDGHRLTALVDTGSSTSLLTSRGMARLGLAAAQTGADAVGELSGVGGQSVVVSHRFSAFRVGGVTVRDPVFLMEAVPAATYDLVLGLDVLGRRRVVLSYGGFTLAFPD